MRIGMSVMGRKQTHAPQQVVFLFDHHVGTSEQTGGHLDIERLRGFRFTTDHALTSVTISS